MRNLNLLLRLIMTLGITACSPKYYTPNTQNIPLITHKGERDFSLSFDANQFNLQGAYAKLQVQYGHSFNLSNHNFKQEDTFLTIGINVNLK